MSRATPKMRGFAKRLIAYETRRNGSFETGVPAAFLACEKLRPHLATLMGNAGFQALLSRAIALGSPEVPWLRAVYVRDDGSFEGLDELAATVGSQEIVDGSVVVLAQLLGLLVAFIGDNLTLGLAREAWPELPLDNLDFGEGEKNEKQKSRR